MSRASGRRLTASFLQEEEIADAAGMVDSGSFDSSGASYEEIDEQGDKKEVSLHLPRHSE